MLNTDMFGNYRFYVKGEKSDLERFTIELTWYHSALAEIGSVAEESYPRDIFILNLRVKDPEREDYLRKLAKQFKCIGFSSFKELKDIGA